MCVHSSSCHVFPLSCTKICLAFIRHIKLPWRRNKNSFCRLISFLWRSLAASLSLSLSLSHSPFLSLYPSYPPNALRSKDWWQYWGQGRTVTPSFRIPLDSTTEHSCSFDWTYLLYHGCPNFSWQRATPLTVGRLGGRTWQNNKKCYKFLPELL